MQNKHTRQMVIISLLIAAEIVLSRFLSFSIWSMKIGFSFLPVVIAAMMFGPIQSGIVGGTADLLGAILFPIGAYFPGFTLTAVLMGVTFGLFLHPAQTYPRILGAVAVNQLILSLLLNTLWISVLYASPYLPLLATRVVQCVVLIPVQLLCIRQISKSLLPILKKALPQRA